MSVGLTAGWWRLLNDILNGINDPRQTPCDQKQRPGDQL